MLTRRPSGHVWSVDVVRLLTFSAVIAVHTLAYTEDPGSVTANGAMLLLQFGREVFFCITGFVLVYSTLGKTVDPRSFWRRRFPFVLVPYLAWSMLYYLVDLVIAPYPSWSWHDLAMDLVDGNAFYHLYFLLVSMQLYLVFPWLIRFVRATAHKAGWVLAGVGLLNVGWLGLLQYHAVPAGTLSWFWNHGYEILPTYSLYVLAGCYAAIYLPTLQSLLRRHPRRSLLLAVALAAGVLGVYAIQLRSMVPRSAGYVLQPAMVAACAAAVIVLGLIGTRWADGPRRGERAVAVGSDISFGVYLAHPLVLTLLLNNGLGNSDQRLTPWLASTLAFAGTVVGASLLSWLARRTPAALPLTGRARLRVRSEPSAPRPSDVGPAVGATAG